MGNAIKKVFPNTRHRFCSWHIRKHETEHLRSYVSRYSDFQETHRKWVNSDTIEQFEATWEDMCIKYELESNCWISDMYNQRIHWAKPFLKDIFFAGMTTTGRSESINSFFDGFVNSKTMLNEFVVQYDKAVESRRAAEEDEDFKTMNSRPVLSSVHPIEAKAGQCYTRKMFDTFKKEWTEAITNLSHNTLTKTTEERTYKVGQLDVDKKILALYVMKKKNVQELPSHYILPRWTLGVRYKLGSVSIGLGEINNENGVSAYTLFCVRSNFTKLIEQSRNSPSEIQKLNSMLINLLDDQANRKKSVSSENASQSFCMGVSQVDMMPQLSVRDPLGPTTSKGRPKLASRIKSSLEAPKKRTCSYCQGLGRYATSCSKRKADESLQET
ncbi:protein FAR1-RELATED SEQUENCE 5-like [Lactuca sativa]|uniref:protein FAR1-RELATED SEQUENCE 5-like n=1 Tax=Lactuca sativa TaxID=4236 RepID=UPI0022AF09A9|nr:protein FAR1-RELATED SEQUENCE 5-like [Lactuca sativa]